MTEYTDPHAGDMTYINDLYLLYGSAAEQKDFIADKHSFLDIVRYHHNCGIKSLYLPISQSCIEILVSESSAENGSSSSISSLPCHSCTSVLANDTL